MTLGTWNERAVDAVRQNYGMSIAVNGGALIGGRCALAAGLAICVDRGGGDNSLV